MALRIELGQITPLQATRNAGGWEAHGELAHCPDVIKRLQPLLTHKLR